MLDENGRHSNKNIHNIGGESILLSFLKYLLKIKTVLEENDRHCNSLNRHLSNTNRHKLHY